MRLRLVSLLLLLCTVPVPAQSLAHPGWRGNGIAAEPWWKHATFVRIGPETTFAQAAQTLEAMSQVGADSVILPDLQPGAALPFDAKFGTEDDLDALLHEASARRMHVLLRVPLLRMGNNSGELRFWMSRGIAGLDVGDVRPADMDTLSLLRGAMDRFPGKRVLLARVPVTASSRSGTDPVTLHLVSPADAVTARPTFLRAIEVAAAGTTPLPPGTVAIFDASRIESEAGRAAVRQMLAVRDRRVARQAPARRSR